MSVEALVMGLCGDRAAGNQMLAGEYSGAAVSGSSLVIATLRVRRNGSVRLLPDKCDWIPLDGKGQADIQAFWSELSALVRVHSTRALLLRLAPPTSRFGGSEAGAVMRTAVQLVPRLQVDVVNTVSVTTWINREDPPLPQWHHPIERAHSAQRRAVEAAAFAARFDGVRLYSLRAA